MRVESYLTRAAKLASAAAALKRQSGRPAPFSLAFLTDADRSANPELVARALPRGSAIIFRDYGAPGRETAARRLLSICRRRGVLLIIGADADLAVRIGAHGVHYPSWSRARPDPGMIISAACHDAAELTRAGSAGADAALLSPVFPTRSHPGAPTLGPDRFKRLAAAARLPVIALGGVDETNAMRLAGRGVAGLAAVSAFSPRSI